MPTTRIFASLIGAAIVAGTLSGCEGGLDLGGMFGGGDAPPAEEQVAVKKPKRKRVPPAKGAAAGKGAKGAKTANAKGADGAPADGAEGAPAPSPSPAPALKPRAFLMRNVAFDQMRTRAMRLVYEGQTKKALATFQDAERARPTDPAVKLWVAAIRQSAQSARKSAHGAETEFNTAAQQLRVPALPAAAPAAAPAAVGGAPTLPRPRVNGNPTPAPVDPKLVF